MIKTISRIGSLAVEVAIFATLMTIALPAAVVAFALRGFDRLINKPEKKEFEESFSDDQKVI